MLTAPVIGAGILMAVLTGVITHTGERLQVFQQVTHAAFDFLWHFLFAFFP